VREGYTDNPLQVHTWPEWIWDGAAAELGSLPPAPPPPVPPPPPGQALARAVAPDPDIIRGIERVTGETYRDGHWYTHSGDPAWESADGDPEGYGDSQPVPRLAQPAWSWEARPDPVLTAWQFADKARMLTGEGDAAFVADLDDAACYVAARRGVSWQPHWDWDRPDPGACRAHNAWPESLWRDVSGAMAQRGAESGEYDLGEDELDAVADGLFPDPEYRPGGKPSPAQFMAGRGDDDFWGYPAPPEDTQAYADWMSMADGVARDEDIRWRDDPYASAWHEPWPPRQETRDAGWGEGGVPRDGDDIRPY
jgi:hypothetical protein